MDIAVSLKQRMLGLLGVPAAAAAAAVSLSGNMATWQICRGDYAFMTLAEDTKACIKAYKFGARDALSNHRLDDEGNDQKTLCHVTYQSTTNLPAVNVLKIFSQVMLSMHCTCACTCA
jgi:hypothetical protein